MNKAILSVILLIGTTTLYAQWERSFFWLMPAEVTNLVERQNGNYAMLVADRSWLMEFTPNGNLVTNEELPYDFRTGSNISLEEAPDSTLVLPGNTGICSSSNGAILSVGSDSTMQEVIIPKGIYQVLPLGGASYMVHNTNNNALQVWSTSGQVIHQAPLGGWKEFFEIERLNDTTVLVITPQHLIAVDTALSHLDTLSGYRGSSLEATESGGFISYDQDSVWLHDAALEVQAVAAASGGAKIKTVATGYGQIIIVQDNQLLRIYDSSLQQLGSFNIDEGIQVEVSTITPTGYLLAGRAGAAPFVKHYEFDGFSESAGYDIALTDLNPERPAIVRMIEVFGSIEVYVFELPNVRFTLENHSQDTVQTLSLATRFPWISYNPWDGCFSFEQSRRRHWENLNFAPGSTIELEWKIEEFEFNNFALIGDPFELCVTAELPNYSFDNNPSNNRNCVITVHVNTPEVPLDAPRMHALPNPASGEVQISWSLPVQGPVVVRLHNSIGQLLYESPGNLAGQVFLPTQAAGLYVASLWQEGRRLAQRKVVWR